MGRRLAAIVHVYDEHGAAHVFGPDDDVPAWAAKAITNPDAWAAGDEPELAPTGEGGGGDGDEPPRGGPGSGRDAWAAYAESKGIAVPDDASRDDIVALVDAEAGAGGSGGSGA